MGWRDWQRAGMREHSEWLRMLTRSGSLGWVRVAQQKAVNPFYSLLVVVGVTFAITACAYGVLTVKMLQPEGAAEVRSSETGLLPFLDRYGLTILMTELGILAVLTFAAIGTDDYWSGQQQDVVKGDEPVAKSGDP